MVIPSKAIKNPPVINKDQTLLYLTMHSKSTIINLYAIKANDKDELEKLLADGVAKKLSAENRK